MMDKILAGFLVLLFIVIVANTDSSDEQNITSTNHVAQPVQPDQPNNVVAKESAGMAQVPDEYLNGVIYMDLKRMGYPKTKVRSFKEWLTDVQNNPENRRVEIDEHTFSNKITVMLHKPKADPIGFTFRESNGEVYIAGYYSLGQSHSPKDSKETLMLYQLIEAAAHTSK